MTEEWNQHKYVQAFLNSDDPTLEEYANAYYIRDIEGLNFSFETVHETAMKKLLMTSKTLQNFIEHDMTQQMINHINKLPLDNYLENNTESVSLNDVNIICNISTIIEQIKNNQKHYEKLRSITNHKEFYRNLSKSDFITLGW